MEEKVNEEVVDNATENVEATSEEKAPIFDKEAAVQESADFLKDMLLTDPNTEEAMFIASNVQMNEDGSISIICVKDFEDDKAVMHTIFSGYVQKKTDDDVEEAPSNIIASPNAGGLVGLDGQPLT